MRGVLRGAVLALGAVTAATALGLYAPAARADSPQQQATALAAQLRSLQTQAERATEAYDQAENRLGQVTAAQFAAERAATASTAASAATSRADGSDVRQLFELGGPAALYTSVLASGGSVLSVQTRLIAAHRVLAADHDAVRASSARTIAARAAQQRADALATEQTRLQQQVLARSAQVQAMLARTQTLLDGANARVVALAAADEAARAARDQAAFQQQLALAQAAPAPVGPLRVSLPAASSVGAAALAFAESLSGHPYVYGGNGPVGYDCSGMTKAAYAHAGVQLPRTAAEQYLAGPHVPLADLQPGDLLFWAYDPADPATIHHTAIYAGNGMMVSANHTGDFIRLQRVWWDGYAGASRP